MVGLSSELRTSNGPQQMVAAGYMLRCSEQCSAVFHVLRPADMPNNAPATRQRWVRANGYKRPNSLRKRGRDAPSTSNAVEQGVQ